MSNGIVAVPDRLLVTPHSGNTSIDQILPPALCDALYSTTSSARPCQTVCPPTRVIEHYSGRVCIETIRSAVRA